MICYSFTVFDLFGRQGNNTVKEAEELYALVKKRLRPPPEKPLKKVGLI